MSKTSIGASDKRQSSVASSSHSKDSGTTKDKSAAKRLKDLAADTGKEKETVSANVKVRIVMIAACSKLIL